MCEEITVKEYPIDHNVLAAPIAHALLIGRPTYHQCVGPRQLLDLSDMLLFCSPFLIFPPKLRSSTMSHLRIQPLLAFVDYAQCWGELGSCSFVPSEHGR